MLNLPRPPIESSGAGMGLHTHRFFACIRLLSLAHFHTRIGQALLEWFKQWALTLYPLCSLLEPFHLWFHLYRNRYPVCPVSSSPPFPTPSRVYERNGGRPKDHG